MTMDKLFDGSDAHLLGANAELIADLRERINPAYADMRGTESYERKLCADALEAADKRIAELEAELERERMRLVACGVIAMADTTDSAKEARKMHPDYESASCSDVARRVDECIELRSKLTVAREALKWIDDQYTAGGAPHAFAAIKAREALAQIGGEDARS